MKKIFTFLISGFACFNLSAQSLSLPYYSGFDNDTEKDGWIQYRTGFESLYKWNIGGGGFSLPNCISHDYNVGGNANDTVIDWFVSPALDFISTGKISLKVKMNGFSTPTPDNCEVWFGTDIADPNSGNYKQIGSMSLVSEKNTWLDTTFDIPYTSNNAFIAIRYKTIGSAWCTYQVDNINITSDSNTSSINKSTTNNSFKVYPNPVKNSATILLSDEVFLPTLEIKIYDLLGKEIKTLQNFESKEISFTNDKLPQGIYVIKLINKQHILGSQKIVVE